MRAYPIGKVLEKHFDVEVSGFSFDEGVFVAYADEFRYQTLPREYFPKFSMQMKRLSNFADGDIIYAFKPRLTTFGVALFNKIMTHKPLVLDIEDFETASSYDIRGRLNLSYFLRRVMMANWRNPSSPQYVHLMEQLTRYADRITVVSNFLQNRFGGIRLPHGANTDLFDPSQYDAAQLRQKLGIDAGQTVILFAGNPKPHKGLDTLCEAISRLSSNYEILLLIVGSDPNDDEIMKLKQRHNTRLLHLTSQPHREMPRFLVASDWVVLPQKNTLYAHAQVPGKVFEAMAMAKPILASRISDLPEILDGCGLIFEPESIDSMVEQMEILLNNRDLAVELGQKAREKCVACYSWEAMEKILLSQVLDRWV